MKQHAGCPVAVGHAGAWVIPWHGRCGCSKLSRPAARPHLHPGLQLPHCCKRRHCSAQQAAGQHDSKIQNKHISPQAAPLRTFIQASSCRMVTK